MLIVSDKYMFGKKKKKKKIVLATYIVCKKQRDKAIKKKRLNELLCV